MGLVRHCDAANLQAEGPAALFAACGSGYRFCVNSIQMLDQPPRGFLAAEPGAFDAA